MCPAKVAFGRDLSYGQLTCLFRQTQGCVSRTVSRAFPTCLERCWEFASILLLLCLERARSATHPPALPCGSAFVVLHASSHRFEVVPPRLRVPVSMGLRCACRNASVSSVSSKIMFLGNQSTHRQIWQGARRNCTQSLAEPFRGGLPSIKACGVAAPEPAVAARRLAVRDPLKESTLQAP